MTIREWFRNTTQAAGLTLQAIRYAYATARVEAMQDEILEPGIVDHITTTEANTTDTDNFIGNGNWEATTTTGQTFNPDTLRDMMEAITNNTGYHPNTLIVNPTLWERMDELGFNAGRNRARGFWDVMPTLHPLDPNIARPSNVVADGLAPVEDQYSPNYR